MRSAVNGCTTRRNASTSDLSSHLMVSTHHGATGGSGGKAPPKSSWGKLARRGLKSMKRRQSGHVYTNEGVRLTVRRRDANKQDVMLEVEGRLVFMDKRDVRVVASRTELKTVVGVDREAIVEQLLEAA